MGTSHCFILLVHMLRITAIFSDNKYKFIKILCVHSIINLTHPLIVFNLDSTVILLCVALFLLNQFFYDSLLQYPNKLVKTPCTNYE